MADTPYGADRQNKIIYTNPKLAKNLTIFEKKFWLLHEKGHIVLDTADEIKADNYAFDRLAGTEFRSLKQMIEASEKLLTSGSAYHQARIDNLYKRALEWDKTHPQVNKATTNQINAMNEGYQKFIQEFGTILIGMQQSSSDSTQQATKTTSLGSTLSATSIIIICIIALLILRK